MSIFFHKKLKKNNVPSYESPSNSESNGIYNINISSIKKIFIRQTLPKIECYHIFSQKTEKNNVPSYKSPSNSESYVIIYFHKNLKK